MIQEWKPNSLLKKNEWSDAHFHLTSVQDFISYQDQVPLFDHFMFGGIGPEDWKQQIELKKQSSAKIELCFGIHPEILATKDCEFADRQILENWVQDSLDLLSQNLHQASALGELGLDMRPRILRELEFLQRDVFIQQLELAEFAAKPVVLHLVQCHHEVMDIFDHWGSPRNGGMVHAFNGSAKKAEDFLKHGLYLSIGGSLVYKNSPQLRQAIHEIPMDRILLESDAVNGEAPVDLYAVAFQVAEIKKQSPEEILNQAGLNFLKFIEKGHNHGTK